MDEKGVKSGVIKMIPGTMSTSSPLVLGTTKIRYHTTIYELLLERPPKCVND